MSEETLSTIEELLSSALELSEDSEVHYKLRTALQLLDVHQEDLSKLEDIEEKDAELHNRLHEMGYLE